MSRILFLKGVKQANLEPTRNMEYQTDDLEFDYNEMLQNPLKDDKL